MAVVESPSRATRHRPKGGIMSTQPIVPASSGAESAHGLGPCARPEDAAHHFEALLGYETDCWDVSEALRARRPGFVVLDVRAPGLFAAGHVPGAVNLPYGKITGSGLDRHGE